MEIVATTIQSICAMGAVSGGIYIGKVDPTLGVAAILAIVGVDLLGKKVAKIPQGTASIIAAATFALGSTAWV